ncbi:MAG TPA: LysE family transporter [Candidatus Obscuribacterales bacterium]
MMASLAGFLMGFIGSMPVAGPTSLLVFHRGMLARYRDGWAIGLGGSLVEGIYCAIAVYAFNILRDHFTIVTPLIRAVSILLLLALGLYFIFASHKKSQRPAIAESSATNCGRQFWIGLSIAALNPTPIFTWSASVATVFPIINLTLQGHEGMVFAASAVIGIVAWFSILLAMLRRFSSHFPLSLLPKAITAIGVILVVVSISLVGSTVYGSVQFSP